MGSEYNESSDEERDKVKQSEDSWSKTSSDEEGASEMEHMSMGEINTGE